MSKKPPLQNQRFKWWEHVTEYTYLLDSENVDIDDKKTKVRNEELEKTLPENILALQIPNAEIREIFETTVVKWFDDSAKIWNRRELFAAV